MARTLTHAASMTVPGADRGHGRHVPWPLSIAGLLVGAMLSGCAGLLHDDKPLASTPAAGEKVEIESGNGAPVSGAAERRILGALEAESGASSILRHHLRYEQAINRGNPLVLGNRLTLLQDGPATYKAMFEAMEKARDHINLETYIFHDDEIGRRFADILIRKRQQGVIVNVIYDSLGSVGTATEFFQRMQQVGIATVEFNPVNPAQLDDDWEINSRNHRKLLVVDGTVAFVGGINISGTYSSSPSGQSIDGYRRRGEPGWRDTHLRIEGPVVAQFQQAFIDHWISQEEARPARAAYFPDVATDGEAIVRAIGSTAEMATNPAYETLLSTIDHAEKHVFLTNAYFAPDPKLLQALIDAAARGVDVRFILPGETDSWAVYHTGHSHYDALLKAGVRVYERQGTVLHSKTATIDGIWSTIGSTNLDWRSYVHNDELNAVILDAGFAEEMEAWFHRDLSHSKEITLRAWRSRPIWMRVQELSARLFEYWL